MKKCPKCMIEHTDENVFCTNCGTRLIEYNTQVYEAANQKGNAINGTTSAIQSNDNNIKSKKNRWKITAIIVIIISSIIIIFLSWLCYDYHQSKEYWYEAWSDELSTYSELTYEYRKYKENTRVGSSSFYSEKGVYCIDKNETLEIPIYYNMSGKVYFYNTNSNINVNWEKVWDKHQTHLIVSGSTSGQYVIKLYDEKKTVVFYILVVVE